MDAPKSRGHAEIRTTQVDYVESVIGDHPGWMRAAALLWTGFGRDMNELVSKCEVREALDALEAKTGLRSLELVVWATVAVQRPKGRVYWERFYTSSTGKSWKALTEFPERIRKMAKELDALRRSRYFSAEEAENFSSLPSKLNDYADWIKSQLEKIPVRGDRARVRGQPGWKYHLSRRVKALTGRFYDIEVARLINAVNVALNGERASEKGVDAQTLADVRSRHKRKAPKT
jgi:hypothetical protein